MPSSLVLPPENEVIDPHTGIAPFVRDKLARLMCGFREIDRAAIYGSRARGDFSSYSDIDLALYGERVTREIAFRVKNLIDDSFIVFPVDVTAVATLAPDSSIRRAIDRDGIVIYDRANPPPAPTSR